MATVHDKLIVARPLEGGFTWTLASRLGQMLRDVETLFGPRNPKFTILGIEFREGQPMIWFPGDCGHIVIQLGTSAMMDHDRALFQLAHECVHLLDPVKEANTLEEGIATWYSLKYCKDLGIEYRLSGNKKYDAAFNLYSKLHALAPDAVKRLRGQGNRVSDISAKQLREICPELDNDLADQLEMPFSNWNPAIS